MNVDVLILMLWILCGMITLITSEKHKVSFWNYLLCWIVLILQLIKNVIE